MRIVFADDLTGACDVAASLGGAAWVATGPEGRTKDAEFEIVNCETRHLLPQEARNVVRRALERFGGPVVYWKMDSLLRGNWAHELAEVVAAGAAERLLVAPAFPEQGRTTRGGFQFAHGAAVDRYLGEGSADIAAQLREAGLKPACFRVADAGNAEELRSAARSLQAGELPAGSAGLARALWGPVPARPAAVDGGVLVVVGTASERGREQMEPLEALRRVRIVRPGPRDDLLPRVEKAVAEELPAALLVVGGYTLSGVTGLLGIEGLMVSGEFSPGVALATISGGALDGRQIITKAGDFGARDTLETAVRALLDMR